jgi:hypothetical protein
MLVPLKIAKFLQISQEAHKVKTLRQITAATVLSLTLSVCVLAGQIESPGVVAPPPPPTSSTTQTTSTATSILLMVLGLIYR